MEEGQVEVIGLCNLYVLCGLVCGKEETTSPFMIGCPLSGIWIPQWDLQVLCVQCIIESYFSYTFYWMTAFSVSSFEL